MLTFYMYKSWNENPTALCDLLTYSIFHTFQLSKHNDASFALGQTTFQAIYFVS